MMNIGSVIKKYRKELGYTQEEMANRLGVTTPFNLTFLLKRSNKKLNFCGM